MLALDALLLRERFIKVVEKKWTYNTHYFNKVSCVYILISMSPIPPYEREIVYVGSTINLEARYKSHSIPTKIQQAGNLNLLYFLPMKKGFYDYEIKLIKKLKPIYNKQHNG